MNLSKVYVQRWIQFRSENTPLEECSQTLPTASFSNVQPNIFIQSLKNAPLLPNLEATYSINLLAIADFLRKFDRAID